MIKDSSAEKFEKKPEMSKEVSEFLEEQESKGALCSMEYNHYIRYIAFLEERFSIKKQLEEIIRLRLEKSQDSTIILENPINFLYADILADIEQKKLNQKAFITFLRWIE